MNVKMAPNNKSVRLLKMKINRPQNIDESYETMYDEEEDASYEDEVNYEDEEDLEDYQEEESNEISEEEDVADVIVEEALPPPPLTEEGETAAKEIIIDGEIGGENELDTSSTPSSENDANAEFKYVQSMPSPSESWSERVSNFNDSNDNMMTVPESVMPPQQILNQNQNAMAQFDDQSELEVVAKEGGDDIDEGVISEEGGRQDGDEDEQDIEEVEDDEEEIQREGDDKEEEDGDVEEESEDDGNEKNQHHEQEDDPEEEVENQQQQQQQEEVEAATSTIGLDPSCKAMKWHPNKEFNQCSNSMDIPQAGVEDETFQKMFFFDTLVECCQKFFHADECENEDVCADLNVAEEVGGIAFERQADGELEDEVPDDEGQPEDDTEEEVAVEEEVANEAEENSNNTSSSTEGQGVQIDETNEKTNWEGFDEDMSPHSSIKRPEQPSSSVQAHDVSEAQGKNDYEGDGFGTMKYKLLRGKGEGGKVAAGSGAWVAAILLIFSCCLCYLRYRRRRYAQSKRPNRGNYSALGRHDFFNGTFSDDVSYGKDSDDDISIESYGSDDGGRQTNLEMGGIHELDANGGLTLEEING